MALQRNDVSFSVDLAEVTVTTGDKTGDYLIRIEGLRDDGAPFTGRAVFKVE